MLNTQPHTNVTGAVPANPTREPDQRLKVFISYSRADLAFADKLVGALEARGLHVLIDRRDLPLLEEWQRELSGFIRQCDAVVYIVSPASIASKWCEWELSQVAALNKRLAPVVAVPIAADASIPEAIGKINFLFFTDPARFEDEADKLARALNTNLPWIKEHTRLSERSWLWRERKQDALLLRGAELADAERWLITQPREAPPPTELHREFIVQSRQSEQARAQQEREQVERTRRFQRRAGWALAAFAALLIAGALATAWQVRETNKREASLYAARASQWSDQGHCDQAMRYALLALPPDGALPVLSVWSPEAEAQLWRAAWGCRLVARIALKQSGVSSVAVAPGNKVLLVTGKDGSALLIETATGQEIGRLVGHKKGIEWGAFSHDGTRAITAGWDDFAIVWDVAARREITRLKGHTDVIYSAAFSPNGQTIATASEDKTARLWNAATGEPEGELRADWWEFRDPTPWLG